MVVHSFTDEDLNRVFEFWTTEDNLSLVRLKGINSGEVSARLDKIFNQLANAIDIYAIAHMVELDTETFLFESACARKFLKVMAKRNRRGDLAVQDLTVTLADAAMAAEFYRGATFQSRDLVLSVLSYVNHISSLRSCSLKSGRPSAPGKRG